LGLRREHYDVVILERPPVPWFEVISENFMVAGGRPRHVLERVRRDYPVVLHGVSLFLGSAEPLNPDHLRRLKSLVDEVEPVLVSDHLCWTGLGGHNTHDLLPLPFTEEAVRRAAAKIRQVQETLDRRILIENISTYLQFDGTTMQEWEFVSAVLAEADCGLLLDLNNVEVNSRNHGFDPLRYLDGLPPDRIAQFHLAGQELDDGDFVVDTHDHAVSDRIWELYRQALHRFGPAPALIERDDKIPELAVLLAEARRADGVAASVIPAGGVRA
jgi:hypothetical protein